MVAAPIHRHRHIVEIMDDHIPKETPHNDTHSSFFSNQQVYRHVYCPVYIYTALRNCGCASCHAPSKQVFAAGWTCLNETCPKFANGVNQGARAWNPAFIGERNRWPAHVKAPMHIKPAPPTAPLDGALVETSLQAWKGMVCTQCGRCNSRTKWDEWRCGTIGCNSMPHSLHLKHARIDQQMDRSQCDKRDGCRQLRLQLHLNLNLNLQTSPHRLSGHSSELTGFGSRLRGEESMLSPL